MNKGGVHPTTDDTWHNSGAEPKQTFKLFIQIITMGVGTGWDGWAHTLPEKNWVGIAHPGFFFGKSLSEDCPHRILCKNNTILCDSETHKDFKRF